MSSNNPPFVELSLTKDEYDFLMENCDSNIVTGLSLLQGIEDKETAIKLIELAEKFKNLRKKLLDANK